MTHKPHALIDALRRTLGEKSDRALSLRLGFSPKHCSHIRGQFRPVSDEMLISIQEETGWSFKHIRSLIPAKQRTLVGHD